jgi:hypothetical protein
MTLSEYSYLQQTTYYTRANAAVSTEYCKCLKLMLLKHVLWRINLLCSVVAAVCVVSSSYDAL